MQLYIFYLGDRHDVWRECTTCKLHNSELIPSYTTDAAHKQLHTIKHGQTNERIYVFI